jgi:hypothetical protein
MPSLNFSIIKGMDFPGMDLSKEKFSSLANKVNLLPGCRKNT